MKRITVKFVNEGSWFDDYETLQLADYEAVTSNEWCDSVGSRYQNLYASEVKTIEKKEADFLSALESDLRSMQEVKPQKYESIMDEIDRVCYSYKL